MPGQSGKIAIVTGATEGIGHAIAQRLAQDGATVALVARRADVLAKVAQELAGKGFAFPTDLADLRAIEALIAQVVAKLGRIDIIVNCASATRAGDVLSIPDHEWVAGFDVKVLGALRLVRAAWPELAKRHGAVISIGGIGARTPRDGAAMTGPLSAALIALTKVFADRGVQDGVRVNAINPGAVLTPRLLSMLDQRAAKRSVSREEAITEMARATDCMRVGRPEDVANVVSFLLSDEAELLHGAIIDLDGGATKGL